MTQPRVKICGITEPETLRAACENGADFIGFAFYPPSPRFIEPEQAASLIRQLPSTVKAVGLFVDPDDEALTAALEAAPVDMIQLHGEESVLRVEEIKARFLRPVIKAFPVRTLNDVEAAYAYEGCADWLLFDAKPVGADLPGGTGQRFDWSLLEGHTLSTPWMLSGGLSSETVEDAMTYLHPPALDVSSGVESTRGVKDAAKIKTFLLKAKP